MQARASQSSRSAAPEPSVTSISHSEVFTERTPSGPPSAHYTNVSGPCGLEIYGDINLLDFANLEGLLTPAPDSEPTALPSSSQLSDLLSIATSCSATKQMSGHLRTSSNSAEHAKGTPVRHSSGHSDSHYDKPSPPTLVSSRVHESLATEEPSVKHPEGNWVSALHIAAQKGHIRIVRVLLQHGVNCNQKDGEGLTPLIHSIISNHEDVLCSLIDHGAHIGQIDNQQRNAVHWAILQQREALLKVLLKNCSSDQQVMEGRDLDGKTPLHTAVDIGFESGVRILLEHGADLNFRAEIHRFVNEK